jgi:hypothetical protein
VAGVQFLAGEIDFSLNSIQTSSGAYPTSVQRVPGAVNSGIKLPGREADSLLSAATCLHGMVVNELGTRITLPLSSMNLMLCSFDLLTIIK